MTQIHVVTSANRHLYETTLDSYHRIRHDVFVTERGWRAVVDACRQLKARLAEWREAVAEE